MGTNWFSEIHTDTHPSYNFDGYLLGVLTGTPTHIIAFLGVQTVSQKFGGPPVTTTVLSGMVSDYLVPNPPWSDKALEKYTHIPV